MDIAIITGSAGLIGSEASDYFAKKGFHIIGLDNDMRAQFFGEEASTKRIKEKLEADIPNYTHNDVDIRDYGKVQRIFEQYHKDIKAVIHTAAQPSHDWAAKEPLTDFTVNANGTMNLLELARKNCPETVFIYTSTNKVYGDLPNKLPLEESETRWELPGGHQYYSGISEGMSIDASKHSLFGASKLAGDVMVQEYGRYFDMKTVAFRGGCLTGPNHSGAELHGFLAYLMKCCVTGNQYTIYGYKGKQVRDNIHSYDLVSAFYQFYENPMNGEVFNIGGGRTHSCSIIEAAAMCEKITGKKMVSTYNTQERSGDHKWYISDLGKFKKKYPGWEQKYSLEETLQQIHDNNASHWK